MSDARNTFSVTTHRHEPDATAMSQLERLVALVEGVRLELTDTARGNASAGVRARHHLRAIKKLCCEMVSHTVELRKRDYAERKERPPWCIPPGREASISVGDGHRAPEAGLRVKDQTGA